MNTSIHRIATLAAATLAALTNTTAQDTAAQDTARAAKASTATRLARPHDLPAEVTFNKHIAPIVFNNCTSCHRPGEGAPFSLMNYKQTRRKARMIARVTRDRIMPPWLPVKGHGKFVGEHRLTTEQIALLDRWAKTGSKEGSGKPPEMPKFPIGWQLGEPDLVVKMPKGFKVPAGGPDIYRNFVVPVGLKETKWITAIEVRPGARSVLHHVIFGMDTTGDARRRDGADGRVGFGGMGRSGGTGGRSTSGLGGWAVGGQPRHLPMGLARELPRGADIVLQSHFHPSGKKEIEQTTLGLHFTDKRPTRTMVGLQMPPQFGAMAGIDIPAGQSDFKIKDSYTLGYDALALTVGGHAHYICKDMHIWATFPGAQKRTSIFWIDRWAFNWQNRYQYEKPLDLPKGTKIDVEITYDNSGQNPSNPHDPPRRVTWGLQSTDEMGSVTLLMVAKHERESRRLNRDIRNQGRRRMREQGDGGRAAIGSFIVMAIQRLDKNGDGKISKDEIPDGRFADRIKEFDTNGDGMIDEKEMKEMANGVTGGFGRRRGGGDGDSGRRRRN